MSRRNLMLLVTFVVVGAGALAANLFLGDRNATDADLIDELADLYAEQMSLTNEVAARSCACTREREGDLADYKECLEHGHVAESDKDELRQCVVDSARGLENAPPSEVTDFLDCGAQIRDETVQCLDEVADGDRCASEEVLDFTADLLGCVTVDHRREWQACIDDVGDDTQEWIMELADAMSKADCIAEPERPVSEVDDIEDPVADRITVDIDTEAISVEGDEVMELVRGQVDDKTRAGSLLEGLKPVVSPLEGFDSDREVEFHLHSLVPHRTVLEVLVSATEAELTYFLWELPGLPGSHVDRNFLDIMPDSLPDAFFDDRAVDGDDAPPLELNIMVVDGGFYITTAQKGEMGPLEGCDDGEATICVVDDGIDIEQRSEAARRAYEDGDDARAAEYYDEVVAAYDFRRLYNVLSELSDEHPTDTVVRISAEGDLPAGLVFHVMETASAKLAEPYYDDVDAFDDDRAAGRVEGIMFVDSMFVVHQ